jgi:hypothetical protein
MIELAMKTRTAERRIGSQNALRLATGPPGEVKDHGAGRNTSMDGGHASAAGDVLDHRCS